MATVIVASSAGRAQKVENFYGRTLGDLKANQLVSRLFEGNLEVIVRPGNHSLRGDDSLLPEGNFNVYLVPTKNKAGQTARYSELGSEIAAAIEKAARIASDDRLEELKDILIGEIEEHFGVTLDGYIGDDDDLAKAVQDAAGLANRGY